MSHSPLSPEGARLFIQFAIVGARWYFHQFDLGLPPLKPNVMKAAIRSGNATIAIPAAGQPYHVAPWVMKYPDTAAIRKYNVATYPVPTPIMDGGTISWIVA